MAARTISPSFDRPARLRVAGKKNYGILVTLEADMPNMPVGHVRMIVMTDLRTSGPRRGRGETNISSL